MLAAGLGVISAVLWIASSIAWYYAAKVPSPHIEAKGGAPDAIIVTSADENGVGGEVSLGGVKVTNFRELDAYNKTVTSRNQWGAWISAAAALFSGAAIIADKWSFFVLP